MESRAADVVICKQQHDLAQASLVVVLRRYARVEDLLKGRARTASGQDREQLKQKHVRVFLQVHLNLLREAHELVDQRHVEILIVFLVICLQLLNVQIAEL